MAENNPDLHSISKILKSKFKTERQLFQAFKAVTIVNNWERLYSTDDKPMKSVIEEVDANQVFTSLQTS